MMHGKAGYNANQTVYEAKFIHRAPIPVKTPNATRYRTKQQPPDIISTLN